MPAEVNWSICLWSLLQYRQLTSVKMVTVSTGSAAAYVMKVSSGISPMMAARSAFYTLAA